MIYAEGPFFRVVDPTPEEIAQLDSQLERVSPGELKWYALGEGPKTMRGLGDVVERLARPVAKALGLNNCGGCKQRQAALNKLVPFKDSSPPR